jgi:hypothetical protein
MEPSPESVLTEPPDEGSCLAQWGGPPCQPFRLNTEFIPFLLVNWLTPINWLTLKIRSTIGRRASMRIPFSRVRMSPQGHDSSFRKIGWSPAALASFRKIGWSPAALASFRKIGWSLIALAYSENKLHLRQSCEHADSTFWGRALPLWHNGRLVVFASRNGDDAATPGPQISCRQPGSASTVILFWMHTCNRDASR